MRDFWKAFWAIVIMGCVVGLLGFSWYVGCKNKAQFYQDNGIYISVWEVMSGFDNNIRVYNR